MRSGPFARTAAGRPSQARRNDLAARPHGFVASWASTTCARIRRKQTVVSGSKFASFCFLFIFFYFLESGLFNGLRAREIKKFARFPQPRAQVVVCNDVKQHRLLLVRPPAGRVVYSVNENTIEMVSDFVKQKWTLIAAPVGLFARRRFPASCPRTMIRGLTRPSARAPSPPFKAVIQKVYPYRWPIAKPVFTVTGVVLR